MGCKKRQARLVSLDSKAIPMSVSAYPKRLGEKMERARWRGVAGQVWWSWLGGSIQIDGFGDG